MTLQDITTKAQDMINSVINGGRSDYFAFDFNEKEWTIRVSNHRANPERVDENTISFVVFVPETESEDSWGVAKKSFKSIPNQFILDENGEFNEQFTDIEECIDYLIN